MATAATHRPGEEPGWRAPVTAGKILSLVRTMNGLGRSGHLRLERNGRAGEVLFHEGELTSASIGPLQGVAALQHLMVWNDGKLELHLRQVPRRGQLHLTAQEFLQEMDRFQRDFAHAMKEIGPPTAVYSASQERLKQAASAVPAEVTPVVRLCNGSREPLRRHRREPVPRARHGAYPRPSGRAGRSHPQRRQAAWRDRRRDERLDAKIVGPSAPDAWPMPAPIGGFPLSTPIPPEEMVTPPPVEEQVTPPPPRLEDQVTPPPLRLEDQVTPPPAVQVAQPAAAGRPRRQTREIAVVPSPTAAPPTAKTPRPVIVVGAPAEKTPRLVPLGRGAGKTPKPVVIVAPRAAAAQGTPPPAEKTPSVAPRVPTATPASPSAVMQAAGVIDSSKHARRSQQHLRAVAPRPSVVIEAIASEEGKPPTPAAGAASPAGAQAAGPPVATRRTTPLMGTLEVRPSRRSAARAVPVVRSSIQLDASLSAPAAPAATQPAAPTVTRPESPGTRVTGELRVTPSGRTTRGPDKAAPKAVVLPHRPIAVGRNTGGGQAGAAQPRWQPARHPTEADRQPPPSARPNG